MPTVEAVSAKRVDKLRTASDVYAVIDFIRGPSGANGSQWLKLDFRDLCQHQPDRTDPHWIEILSNELLGELAESKLVILPPTQSRGRRNLDRSGVSFAIKQRASEITDIHTDGSASAWPAHDWAGKWTPTNTNFRRKIFQEKYEPDVLLDREFVTFLNPHYAASEADLSAELTDNQATNWIRGLIRKRLRGKSSNEQHRQIEQTLVCDMRAITYELVSNLKYAFKAQGNGAENVPTNRQRSYVQLYTTRGGTKSYDRLHFIVADMGHGIVRTIAQKLPSDPELRGGNPEKTVRDLLMGTLPYYGQSSGEGYQKIVDIIKHFKGELYLTTGSSSSAGGVDVVRAVLSYQAENDGDLIVEADARLGFIGTTAHVIIPLEISVN